MRLDVVVDDTVVAPIDDTIVVEIAVCVIVRAGNLDEVVDDAVIAIVDYAVEAFTRLGLPLRVVGKGPEEARLRSMAGPNITFLGPVDDATLAALGESPLPLPTIKDHP